MFILELYKQTVQENVIFKSLSDGTDWHIHFFTLLLFRTSNVPYRMVQHIQFFSTSSTLAHLLILTLQHIPYITSSIEHHLQNIIYSTSSVAQHILHEGFVEHPPLKHILPVSRTNSQTCHVFSIYSISNLIIFRQVLQKICIPAVSTTLVVSQMI